MKEHEQNGLQIARYLEEHPRIKKVYYPGLASHPQYDLAKKQMSGFGGMLSFEIDGGLKEAELFLESLRVFALAESLGGVESLIEHPAKMTHASVPPKVREEVGITDSLIRISVGIEHIDDLIEDLDQALKKIS
jgi:cystathionine gamma-lyase